MDPSYGSYGSALMEHYNYYNLVTNNTCFKGDGSCIDLILTIRKCCFKNTSLFETDITDPPWTQDVNWMYKRRSEDVSRATTIFIIRCCKQNLKKKNQKSYLLQS